MPIISLQLVLKDNISAQIKAIRSVHVVMKKIFHPVFHSCFVHTNLDRAMGNIIRWVSVYVLLQQY